MPARTRSCAVCRKKRIKCDATVPHCLMCIRFGRQCPGLVDEPLIVDMTARAQHGMRKRKRKSSSPAVGGGTRQASCGISQRRISIQGMITEAFYERFLSSWTSEGDRKDIRNKESWLHRLPRLSTDGSNQALLLALQATASSFCAFETRNFALTRHAWDLYGQAVKSHGSLLARSRSRNVKITIHMISTSILFSVFETMHATTADAYWAHIWGAAKMFEVVDPQQCSEGVLCQLFFHLRTQMTFTQLTNAGRRPSIAVRDILHNALEYEELPVFQRLTTYLSALADLQDEADAIGGNDGPNIAKECDSIRTGVDRLWQEYNETAILDGTVLAWEDGITNTTQYRDAFTALSVAYFSATQILLEVLAPELMAVVKDPVDHFERILHVAQRLGTWDVGCAFMRMAAPLFLVAQYSPVVSQRDLAVQYFDRWKTGSMRGISALAFDHIKQRAVVGAETVTSRSGC